MKTQENYTFKKFGDKYIISIANHCEVLSTIAQFCKEQNIILGTISGIGTINNATLRFFNHKTKDYTDISFSEQMEIANITGNISTLKDDVYIHLHAILGRKDYTSITGHLLSATLSGAGEFVVESCDGEIERYYDPEIGLNIYRLEKK